MDSGLWYGQFMNNESREKFDIQPIEHVDVYRSVLAQLERLVTRGNLQRGDRLPSERELAQRLNVSRVSIREAVRVLESLGKVEVRRNAGIFVTNAGDSGLLRFFESFIPTGDSFLNNLVDVRTAIEVQIVKSLARSDEYDLEPIETLLKTIDEEISNEQAADGLDLRFEAALSRLIDNPVLQDLHNAVLNTWIDAWSRRQIAPGNKEHLHSEHWNIYRAIAGRDPQLAQKLVESHVERIVDSRLGQGD